MKQSNTPEPFTVAVIGLGYVGLPLALEFARAGCRVLGLDIDASKTQQLQEGHCYLQQVDASGLKDLVKRGLFCPSTDFKCLHQAQAVAICVLAGLTPPTILGISRN